MEFNVEPYYDDFEENALNNNYVRILFKPGQAVQARELTQIQSILQNQIKQFGDHIFQDGSPVIGGNLTLDNKVKYVKLEETFNNEDVDISLFDGKIVRSLDGLVQAKVLTTYFPPDGTPTLLVRYITGNEFTDAAVVKIAGTNIQARAISSAATGFGLVCSINQGVFYVDGFFVQVDNQTTVVSAYDTSANVKIGLEISDDLVDSVVDTTLLDPAQGSFNYQAPGADRYQFNLNLSTRPLNANVDESKFFELMRVENGAITKQVKYPVYAELEKTLARRTFDESGDYTVKPFRATIKDDVDTNNYVVSVEPGKAYVKGFEFETIGTLKVVVPKPRSASDVKTIVDTDVDTSYGNFIYVTSLKGTSNGLFNIAALEKIDVHVGGKSEIYATGAGNGTANAFLYANTKIGTVRVKNFARHVSDVFNANVDTNGIYKLYITDVVIQPKVLKVNGASAFANTINLSTKFAFNVNNYTNVSVTILPVRLDAVANVNTANVIVNSYRLNANSGVASVFTGNVNVGSTIRVADMVRRVVSVNTAGDYLTVNRAWDKTIIGTSATSNPLEVLVQSNYVQNVSTQTRTIISGANTSGNLVFTLDRDFNDGGKADANTVVQFNFGIKDAKSFCSGPVVANTLATNANIAIDVSSLSKLVNGSTVVQDIERNKLIFRLPGNHVKKASINNTDYIHSKLILDRSNTGNPGEFTVAQGSGLETFETIPWADSTSAIQDNLIFIVRNNNGNTSFPNGSVIQLTSANVSLSGSPTDTITIDTQIGDILKADIILNVKENDAEDKLRTKVFMSNTTYVTTPSFTYPTSNSLANVTVTLPNLGEVAKIDVANGLVWLTNPGYNAVYPGDSISLFVPDVVRIRKIFASNTTTVPQGDANTVDITNNFLIDYGQRDDRYEHAKLVLKTGYDSPNRMLLVHADFYQHIYAVGTNVSFFSADSYSDAIYNSESVPIYRASTGEVYFLRDCLDFRPTQAIGDTSTAFTVPNIPTPDETTELSFEHYLPRIDKLVLSKDKEFRVITGRSALKPYPPADLDDAMTLYTISVPPYAADLSRFKMKYVDHRRLTMRDLANLQKRVESLEYYTSFNNTELLALSDKTTYEDGTEKEKYGIVGENFRNFNIADYKSPDFNVALDGGFMIPSMRTYTNQFTKKTTTSTKQNKKTITLNYTETPAITQGLVSNNAVSIQPFLFGSFNGTLELTPETDFWINENLKPEVISVPERIIEIHTVITETIREPIQPVTIINNYPVTNVTTIITTTPNVDPPSPPGPPPPPPPGPPPVVGTPPVDLPPDSPPQPPIYNCPAPWMMIQLVGGDNIPAGELKPGMFVETYHEHTQKFGAYEVTHVESVQDAKRVQIKFDHVDFVCSYDHKFYKDGDWITVSDLVVGDLVGFAPNEYKVLEISEYDTGEVMRITVDDAHTYICEGILSHNKVPPVLPPPQPPLPQPPGPPPIEYDFEIDPCFCFGPINFSGGGVAGSSSCYNYTLIGLNSAIPAYEGELVGAYCSGGGFYNFGGISDGIIYPSIVYPVEAPPPPVESTIPDSTPPVYAGGGGGALITPEFVMDDSGTGMNVMEFMSYNFDRE